MPLKTSLYRKPASARWPRRLSKRRDVISVNMISLPLGDFRHLSHIGSDGQGDRFGDLSFLKHGHSLLLQSSQSEQNLFLACSPPPPPKPPRLNLDEAEGQESPNWPARRQSSAHRRKKCSSLPLLDSEEGDMVEDEPPGSDRTSTSTSTSPGHGSLNSGRDYSQAPMDISQPDEIDSAFSFSLDLGPSILDDVLQVMNKHHQ
ncbi:cdc42 effector protein 3-like [Alosa sapidissima]|uniref:cdc42 effector protein 3-like n=1 Tax=Alosa sapidissima TaxID=34773 RepID=UPI001C08ACC5|nr:cdc42 effector protein 3-like [Alosa sapidissima]